VVFFDSADWGGGRREGVALTGEARLGLIEREVHRLIAEGGDA